MNLSGPVWKLFLVAILILIIIGIIIFIPSIGEFRSSEKYVKHNINKAILIGLNYYDPKVYINRYMDPIEFISFKILYTNFVPNEEIVKRYQILLDDPEITSKYLGYLFYFFNNMSVKDYPSLEALLEVPFLKTDYDPISEITFRALFCHEVPVPEEMFDEIEKIGERGGYDLTHIYGAVQLLEERGCDPEKTEKVKKKLIKLIYEEQKRDGDRISDFSLYAQRVGILVISGNGNLADPKWIANIIDAQNLDGGWPHHKLGEPSYSHSTYYALLVLLSYKKYVLERNPLDYSVLKPFNLKVARISPKVKEEIETKGTADAIVEVESDKAKEKILSMFGGEELDDNMVKITLSRDGLENLSSIFEFSYVYPDEKVNILSTDYNQIINYNAAVSEFGFSGSNIKICILDTGVNTSLIDYYEGKDFVNHHGVPEDGNGHGTMVASIVKSIAPDSKLIVAKVINDQGIGRASNVIRGIHYCKKKGADIILIGFGGRLNDGFCDFDPIAIASNYAVRKGIVVVAPTGNDAFRDSITSPACARNVVAVSATDDQDRIASFSNVNPLTDVLAPGVNISTQAGVLTGTSAAAPQVAAAAALLLEKEPTLTPAEVEYRLRSTGKPIEFQYNSTLTVNISRLDLYNLLTDNKTMEPYDYSGWGWSSKFRPSIFVRVEGILPPPITYEGTSSTTTSTSTSIISTIDNNPPTVQFEAPTPADGSYVSGTQVINVSATDDVEISDISIFIDNSPKAMCTSSSCSYSWNTTSYSDGSHSFYAVACDTTDICTSTETRNVFVDNTAPTGSISHSPTIVTSQDTVTFTASGLDSGSGLQKIEIYVDGTLQTSCLSSPCSYQSGPYSAQGTHTYYAKIYDNVGNVYITSTGSFYVYAALYSCTAITSSGKYALTADIINSTASKCFDIQVNNVEIDCQGHTVDGIYKWTTFGFYIYRSTTQATNVTIKNCNVSQWIYGIYMYRSTDNEVRNTTVEKSWSGIYVNAYSYNNILDNLTLQNNYGFDLWVHGAGSCNNQVTNVIGSGDKPIVYFHDQAVTVKDWNNNISSLILCNADYSVIDNVTIINTGYENNAIILRYTDHTNLTNIYVKDMEYGIYLHGSYDRLENVTAISNIHGIYSSFATYPTVRNVETRDNTVSDYLYYGSDDTAYCDATFENVTGTGGKPIVFFGNQPATIRNWNNNFSEIILCNADGSVIENVTFDNTLENNMIMLIGTDNSLLSGLNLTDLRYGIYLWYYSEGNTIRDSVITSSASWAMRLYYRCNNNIIENVTFKSNNYGLRMYRSSGNVVKNSRFEGNTGQAIYLYYAGDTAPNKFYNNFFNNTYNFYFAGTVYKNEWNTNMKFEKNKVGGPYLGGNYWGKPDGTGFSDTCSDSDGNGICDSSYQLHTTGPNVDYYPLSLKYDTTPPSTWATSVDSYGDSYTFGTESTGEYVRVTLHCSDDKAGCYYIQYCTDTTNTCVPSEIYTVPIEVTQQGTTYIRFRGIDKYGNVETINTVPVILNTSVEKVVIEMEFNIGGIENDVTSVGGSYGTGTYMSNEISEYYTCSYDSVLEDNPTVAMIFTGSKFDYASVSYEGTKTVMKISQYYHGNHLIIPFTEGSCSVISQKYETISDVASTPLSAIGMEEEYPVYAELKYEGVDIVGDYTIGEGEHTLVFEKNETPSGIQIIVEKR